MGRKKVAPEPLEDRHAHVIERPDGYYWLDDRTGEEYGPFATLREAEEDMQFGTQSEAGADELLLDAEDEIGMADWLDPDTGEPAEESIPHIEDN